MSFLSFVTLHARIPHNTIQYNTAFDHEVRKVLVLLVHVSPFDDVALHVWA